MNRISKSKKALKEIITNIEGWIKHCDSAKEEGTALMLQGIKGLANRGLKN